MMEHNVGGFRVTKFYISRSGKKHLTLKAPPIMLRRRKLKKIPLFFQKQQLRHDISRESSAGRRFSCNIMSYFF